MSDEIVGVGDEEPNWTKTAYYKGDRVELSNDDFDGWRVLFWYPKDFTFICPTEIREFNDLLGEFKDEGIDVIGASTDTYFTHENWFEDNPDEFPEGISYPVLADTNHSLSEAFGVLHEDEGVARRATVVIGPDDTVRAKHVNALEVGRSPREVLRTAQACISDGMCGADWEPGDEFAG
ncbi:MAG: peroxiredoxin [Bradymonadaceae bacterium]